MSNPITPPPELVQQWDIEGRHQDYCTVASHIAARAAQWGADQELEACCDELDEINPDKYWSQRLRAARRPNFSNLKKEALEALGRFNTNTHTTAQQMHNDFDLLRRALEASSDV
jgi:hypothetical protein